MMNPGDWIDCVDTWQGGEEHAEEDMMSVEQRFDHNIAVALNGPTAASREYHVRLASPGGDATNNRVYKHKAKSTEFLGRKLAHWLDCKDLYDFIYIDGSHTAPDVLTDACMAWPLLKPKGMMVFDDYMWGEPRDILHRPKPAIDAFCNLFAETAEIVHVGYQLIVRKKEQN
jgi:Methyltransferase domain